MLRRNLLAALVAAATAGPAVAGSAILQWEGPVTNEDGSPLTDLAGYRIRWGCVTPGDYPNEVTILYPGLRSFEVQNLPNTGTCHFTVHAINTGHVAVGDGIPARTSESSAPANPAQKAMTSAPPVRPYTRTVDWAPAPSLPPLELVDAARMYVGFVGDPLVIRANATSTPTRSELRATFFQSGEQIVVPFTTPSLMWAPPFVGLWELEVRSCDADGCGPWRSSREDNAVFWFKLKPPTGGGIDP